MMRNSILACTAIVAVALSAPAGAQTLQEQARFAQAQSRFQNELARFQSEFDTYRAAQARDQRGGYYNSGPGPAPRVPYPSQYDDQRYDDQGSDDRGQYEQDDNGYDPAQYYRSGPQYQQRVLSSDDRVYAGNDGRYYCKRNDGTTGLIVGGAAGGILGNVIDGGHSRIVGTLIGGAAGALAGKSIDQNNKQIVCR